MATARPFAYNPPPNAVIAGTEQVGSLAIGTPTSGFTSNPQFWNGPDEELGYVIAKPISGNTQPTPIPGVFASVGFLGTKNMSNPLSEATFVELTNSSFNQNFTTGNDASTWLTSNGYWNSWVSITPTPTATLVITPTPTNTATPTNTVTPTNTPTLTQTPTSTDLTNITTYTISGCTSLNEFVANLGPGALAPGDIFYFEFTGGTPSGCYRIVNKINAVPTDGTTPLYFYTSCALCVAAREVTPTPTVTNTQTPTLTQTPTNTATNTATPTNTPTPTITPTNISCLNIATNAGGGLDGFSVGGQAVGMAISANPAVGTTYPIGSFITFQNGEVRTLVGIDDYGAQYDVFYSSPISTSILFPITICYPSIPTPTPTITNTATPTGTPSVTSTPTPTATSVTPTPTPTSGVSGNFNVTISQVGSDVVWSGSGSFNLAALTSAEPSSVGAGYASNLAIWAIGPGAPVDTYIGTITYPLTFGTTAVPVTSASGSTFGILQGGSGRSLYVPSGYVSNTNISGTATYINTTIASAGLTPGTYTWSWGTGGNTSTLVMTISS